MAFRSTQYNRFESFQEFADGKGFVIEEDDISTEFFYDQVKGWFDEKGKYYDKNGTFVASPSKESLKFWETIKDEYVRDDLVDQYERDMSHGGGSDQDGDDDDYHQGRQERQPYRGNNDNYRNNDHRRQVPELSRRDDTKRPDVKPVSTGTVGPKKIEFKKSEPVQVRSEVKKEEVQTKVSVTPVVAAPQVKKPEIVGNQRTVTISGVEVNEPEDAFLKWLNSKISPITFVSQRSRAGDKHRDYKFVFSNLLDAEDVLSALKLNETGKVSYKAKFSLICKLDKQ